MSETNFGSIHWPIQVSIWRASSQMPTSFLSTKQYEKSLKKIMKKKKKIPSTIDFDHF